MWSVLLVTLFLSIAICVVVYVPLIHSSWGDRNDAFVTHAIIITRSMISIFRIVGLFLSSCVSEGVVPSCSVSCVIPIPGRLEGWVFHHHHNSDVKQNHVHYKIEYWKQLFFCPLLLCSLFSVQKSGTLWLEGRVHLFARLSHFSQLYFMQCTGLCVFVWTIYLVILLSASNRKTESLATV